MPNFYANFGEQTLHLPWCRDPFAQALAVLQAKGLPMHGVLWVLPRVALTTELERAWLAAYAPNSTEPQRSPWVQSADRLSQTTAKAPWLGLLADVAALLKQQPSLGGHLPAEALWRLADEYLNLALRLVARHSSHTEPDMGLPVQTNSLAAMEVQCVQQMAALLHEQLLPLLPPAFPTPEPIQAVVWFDDGDPWPGLWLARHYPEQPRWRVVLPLAQGPECWQDAAQHRAKGPWADNVRLATAPDETRQAQQAAHQILHWLHEDPHTSVVVAVLDRLAARRLVPLLADQGLAVDDRTGWRLSTATVASWLDSLLSTMVQKGQVQSLCHPLETQEIHLPHPWLLGGERTVAGWATAVLQGLQELGAQNALQNDAAGRLLLYSLRLCMATQSQALWPLAAWQAAWRFVAEGLRFRPTDTPSLVRLVPLLSTRMHGDTRVLVLGCAQRHFQESPPGLLPPPILAELGLVGPRLVRQQKLSALLELLHSTPTVHMLHAATVQGQAQRLLPELQWLNIVRTQLQQNPWHQQAANMTYPVCTLPQEPLQLHRAQTQQGQATLPSVPVRAVEDWQACPLRFGLKYAMPWPLAPLPTPMQFEQCRGIFVHKVLEKTCQALQQVEQPNKTIWHTMLKTQMHSVWQGMPLTEQAVVLPFLSTLERLIPSIAECLQQRHDTGWHLQQQEGRVRGEVWLANLGQAVTLAGRVDRVEKRAKQLCIVDIKTSNPKQLNKQAKNPETSPQLPLYQALLHAPNAELAYLAVHEDGVAWVPLAPWSQPIPENTEAQSWGELWMHRLQHEWSTFFDGHTLWQAQTNAKVCLQCDVRALCRPPLNTTVDEDETTEQEEPT